MAALIDATLICMVLPLSVTSEALAALRRLKLAIVGIGSYGIGGSWARVQLV